MNTDLIDEKLEKQDLYPNKYTSFLYLGAPYDHEDPFIKEYRLEEVNDVATYLVNLGFKIFSPLTQSTVFLQYGADLTHEEWLSLDKPFMDAASAMILLELDGWKTSKGVKIEMDTFRNGNKRIFRL